MLYLYLALIAQALNALVVLLDKYLIVSKAVAKPMVYAFYIAILSGVVVLVLPFGLVSLPSLNIIFFSLAISFSYVFAILFLYRALVDADASDAGPVMGAVAAASTLLFSFLILGNRLSDNFLAGFLLLVAGTALMSYFRFNKKSLVNILAAGVLFGVSSVLAKEIFLETDFVNGFFWSRMGNVVAALALLLPTANRKSIFRHLVTSPFKVKYLVLGNKALAGFAFLLFLLAINIGDVSLVNAVAGTQFVFLLLLALIFTKKFPNYFYESVHHFHAVVQKLAAVILIVFGYFLLFL